MHSTCIRVHLLSFGSLKTIFPEGGDWRELEAGESVAGLLAKLCAEGILAEAASRTSAIAVNHEYAAPGQTLHDGDEIAILPPVSGGAESTAQIALVQESINPSAIL